MFSGWSTPSTGRAASLAHALDCCRAVVCSHLDPDHRDGKLSRSASCTNSLAAFWLIGAIAMIPWYFRGVEGRGRSLEALVR